MNNKKTKELIVDFRRKANGNYSNVLINDETVERVCEFKYLGVTLDEKLNLDTHIRTTVGKMKRRMFLIKRLRRAGIKHQLVKLAYRAFVEPLSMYAYAAINRMLTQKNRRILWQVHKEAHMMGVIDMNTIAKTLESREASFIERLRTTQTHPLFQEFETSRSRRIMGKYNTMYCRSSRFQNSIVPHALLGLSSAVRS